jgi:hypothetical protein
VPPITIDSTEEQIRQAVATARVGRKLTPEAWPNGARVAVCLTFDVDNELLQRANPLPVGGRRSRIVQLDRLITYIKSKHDVWFATMEQVAYYVKQPRW